MVAPEESSRKYDLMIAVEMMLRQHFGSLSRKGKSIKQSQDEVTRLILRFVGGDSAEDEYVKSEVKLHTDKGVSPLWLSEYFTLPLFAIAAESYSDLLSPSGKGFIKTSIKIEPDSFFGLSLSDITTQGGYEQNHLFNLHVLAATKSYLTSVPFMRRTHDLVMKRIAEQGEGQW